MWIRIRDITAEKECYKDRERQEWEDVRRWGVSAQWNSSCTIICYQTVHIPDFEV